MAPSCKMLQLGLLLVISAVAVIDAQATQADVDYIAAFTDIRYKVVDNYQNTSGMFVVELTLTNTGTRPIATSGWQIYLTGVSMIESQTIRPNGTELGGTKLKAFHVQGSLQRIEPMDGFAGIGAGAALVVRYHSGGYQVSRLYSLPGFYVTSSAAQPRTITSTSSRQLTYVDPFLTPYQYKRSATEVYSPPTAAERFAANPPAREPLPILPTPLSYTNVDLAYRLNVHTGDWVVVEQDARVHQEALLLAQSLGLPLVTQGAPSARYITVGLNSAAHNTDDGKHEQSSKQGKVKVNRLPTTDESYKVEAAVNPTPFISVTANTTTGVFWGTQSVLALDADPRGIPVGVVTDGPRFPYRGVHADVCRNFQSKDAILKLIDTMAMYKLNYLHMHIGDDEGWRLEIPGLPELTEVGGNRCHDLTGDRCLMPQLGSSPVSSLPGSGFYTVADYKEIVAHAAQRHIIVIPEFDMPGHSHAAINAMEARYRRFMAVNDTVSANQYRLKDPLDTTQYLSIQSYTDNAINPCIESTYTFVTHVVQQVKAMHAGIQDLVVYNFGGDETAHDAWAASPACVPFNMSHEQLMEVFVKRVAQITQAEGLSLVGWEDGLLGDGGYPYERESVENDEVIGISWSNVWEWGGGNGAYRMANANYKVIIAHATHLYFDHPHEPDPEECCLHWATRFTNASKAHGFIPDDVYANIGVDGYGHPLDREQVCSSMDCTPLNEEFRHNIIGMQGQLWTETVRYEDEFFGMYFPRLLALAERAWHKAPWEANITDPANQLLRQADFENFASTLGQRELLRLDRLGVAYHLPVPGGRLTGNLLEANVEYPGLTIRYSADDGNTWSDYVSGGVTVQPGRTYILSSVSADGSRLSRQSTVS